MPKSPHECRTPADFNALIAAFQPGQMGVEITACAPEAVEGRLPAVPRTMAPNGFMHAASVVTLADTLCGLGCWLNLPEGAANFTTIELKSNMMGTVRAGDAVGIATPMHLGRSTQVWDATVRSGETGKTVALFRCTQMVLWPK